MKTSLACRPRLVHRKGVTVARLKCPVNCYEGFYSSSAGSGCSKNKLLFLTLEEATMPYRLGVDVGGTFTDLILVDETTGAIHTAKVPSTPSDSSIGVMNGIERVCSYASVDPSEIDQIMHGNYMSLIRIEKKQGVKILYFLQRQDVDE